MRSLYKIDPASQNSDMMVRFALPLLFAGSLAAPIAAEELGPRAPVPKGHLPADYPRQAVWNEQEGRVSYRLTIDERGRVSSCVVTISSGYRLLDEGTCRILRKARFEPALDANGKPTTGTYESTAVYDLH